MCETRFIGLYNSGGQSGADVTRLHGNHQDVGSNPATARNEKIRHWGTPPAQKVAQGSGQDLSGRPAMLNRTRPVEKTNKKKEKKERLLWFEAVFVKWL